MEDTEQALELHLYSMEVSSCLAMAPINQESIMRYGELVGIFGQYRNGGIEVEPEHVMTHELKNQVFSFCDRYKCSYPILNGFKKSFSKIPEGKHFFVLSTRIAGNAEVVRLFNYIDTRNQKLPEQDFIDAYNGINTEHFSIFGSVMDNYRIDLASSDTRTHIGESDRSERVCRFCGKSTTDPGVTFRNVAHAIPEALGNKGLVLNEECDTCNELFGKTIEPDLISFFKLHRVFWAIKGKNGVPKIKFKNGCIAHKEGRVEIGYKPSLGEVATIDLKQVTLYSHDRIATANIYKSLCKIALSVIDADKLRYFGRTISWLLAEEDQPQVLPRVALLTAPQMRVESPQILLYERQSAMVDLPHLVAEFKLKTMVFVFIVPFSDLDSKTFFSDEEYSSFWQGFPHYAAVDGWIYERFDNPKKLENSLTVGLSKSTFLRLCGDECRRC